MLKHKVFHAEYEQSLCPAMTAGSEQAIEKAVAKANHWLAENKVELVNIETITETAGGGMTSVDKYVTAIRVWYTES